ncbi:E3 ubiquitin-protein ligase RGLG2 [Ricinus communis]|uniref:Copine, putative n=1 Tax=Ricinus communis TaxID=3988 RepID=B9RMT9_RICCO|nr:E3 ubiquitin-protein ligase RGLG2 [Ricinus communis]EEF47612.1 copine, putative [Ricinus communis]|eukprot:XP_015572228.1 E3 ubiquitin-protein ligase RGLG2 [Ricinus communis]
MGGRSSKGSSGRHIPSYGSANSSSSWNQYGYPQASPYPYPSSQQNPYYTPQHPQPSTSSSSSSTYSHEAGMTQPQKRLDRKYSRIADDYKTLDQVTAALAQSGLESSNLIVGIDFTKSNEWTGARSYNRRSLHHIGNGQNPYEQAISIIGRTLSAFDEDNLIPCFGFGDASTHDQDVFSFHQDERFCNGFEEVLTRYREIVPQLRLAGPTSFAPIIDMAITIVEQSGGQYHVLLIIADGQVTRSIDTQHGQLSPQEQRTIDAIVKASEYPLSIILVGVGDGPWDMMREFDDNIPARVFDNFQFVNFTEIMSKNVNQSRKETEFALAALMEIPAQYKATIELGILGQRTGNCPERVPLPPPIRGASSFSNSPKPSQSSSFQQRAPSYSGYDASGPSYSGYDGSVPSYSGQDTVVAGYDTPVNTNPHASSTYDNQVCPICLTNRKDMAFGCGHQTCCECGEDLQLCPICRSPIQTRIRLY